MNKPTESNMQSLIKLLQDGIELIMLDIQDNPKEYKGRKDIFESINKFLVSVENLNWFDEELEAINEKVQIALSCPIKSKEELN